MDSSMTNRMTRWRCWLFAVCFMLSDKIVISFSIEKARACTNFRLNSAFLRKGSVSSINNSQHQKKQATHQRCKESQKPIGLNSVTYKEEGGENNKININSDFSTKEPKRPDKNVGGYDPSERLGGRQVNVGDPQLKLQEKEFSVTAILRELKAIQQKGPQKYCILGTRHCSYMHQQIIELLAYALVLSGNHVYTSGAGGTHAATIRGALRAERPELLTVVLPQSMSKQPEESQKLLKQVEDIIAMPQNDELTLDVASRLCNSVLLSKTDQLISFAFHESTTVIEAVKEAKKLDMLVTVLYLD